MNDDQKFWVRFWAIIVCGLVLITLTLSIAVCYDRKMMVSKDMEQVTVVGYQGYLWQKVDHK
jgi:uncharacterized protein YqhQ